MEKFLLGLVLLIAVHCARSLIHNTIPQHHHRARHKHNFVQFDDQRVNEIREAFDDYKIAVLKPKVKFDDAIKLKPLRYHRPDDGKMNDRLTETASDDRIVNGETSIADLRGHLTTRYKRVHDEATTHNDEPPKTSFDFIDGDVDDAAIRKPSPADDSSRVTVKVR